MKMGKGRKEDGYATTDYSSVQERQKTRKGVQRKEKQDRKDFFFFVFFFFFNFSINNKKRN